MTARRREVSPRGWSAAALHRPPVSPPPPSVSGFAQLTAQQKKSGLAAWLGWMFDGLDMHLYTLVAAPFVMHLLGAARSARSFSASR